MQEGKVKKLKQSSFEPRRHREKIEPTYETKTHTKTPNNTFNHMHTTYKHTRTKCINYLEMEPTGTRIIKENSKCIMARYTRSTPLITNEHTNDDNHPKIIAGESTAKWQKIQKHRPQSMLKLAKCIPLYGIHTWAMYIHDRTKVCPLTLPDLLTQNVPGLLVWTSGFPVY